MGVSLDGVKMHVFSSKSVPSLYLMFPQYFLACIIYSLHCPLTISPTVLFFCRVLLAWSPALLAIDDAVACLRVCG